MAEIVPPAPWTVEYDSEVMDVDRGGEARWVAGIKPVVEYIDFEPGVDEESVAHLMAAAPMLKDALMWALEQTDAFEDDGERVRLSKDWREWADRARAAIAATEAPS